MQYKYIRCLHQAGGNTDYLLTKPFPCSNEYFIEAFWMPIKHQIGKKLSFLPNPDKRHFGLCYNFLVTIGDVDSITPEQIEICRQDSKKVIGIALSHIDNIMEHFYCEIPDSGVVPFIDECHPIASVIDNTITMRGRLPMQESYFIEKYWTGIVKHYHETNKGIRFKIHFSKLGTMVSVSAELCRDNSIRDKKKAPRQDGNEVAKHQLQAITCDLVDAIQDAAYEYAEACKKNQF